MIVFNVTPDPALMFLENDEEVEILVEFLAEERASDSLYECSELTYPLFVLGVDNEILLLSELLNEADIVVNMDFTLEADCDFADVLLLTFEDPSSVLDVVEKLDEIYMVLESEVITSRVVDLFPPTSVFSSLSNDDNHEEGPLESEVLVTIDDGLLLELLASEDINISSTMYSVVVTSVEIGISSIEVSDLISVCGTHDVNSSGIFVTCSIVLVIVSVVLMVLDETWVATFAPVITMYEVPYDVNV